LVVNKNGTIVKEILESKFLKFEKDNNLFDKKIANYKFWEYIRFQIYSEIFFQNRGQNYQFSKKVQSKSIFHSLKIALRLISNSLLFNPFWNLKKKDMIVINHSRRININGYYTDPYVDPILDKLNLSFQAFEDHDIDGKHFLPAQTKNIKYFDFFVVVKRLSYLIRYRDFKLSNEDKLIFANIEKTFGVKFDYNSIKKLLANILIENKVLSKFYYRLIDKVNPKIILEVCHYTERRMMINKVAKDRGVNVIELQHGVMGRNHVAYNLKSSYGLEAFPNNIFLFGEFWKNNTNFPIPSSNIFSTGFPYIEQKISNSSKSNNNGKKTLLFISSYYSDLVDLAIKISEKLNDEDYRIIYKLHPKEYNSWKYEYPHLLDSNMEVVDNNDHDIYHYFAKSDFQIGIASTAIFEGLAFKLKTFVLDLSHNPLKEELSSFSQITFIKSAQDLINNLDNKDVPNSNINYLWGKNSLKKIHFLLDRFVNT